MTISRIFYSFLFSFFLLATPSIAAEDDIIILDEGAQKQDDADSFLDFIRRHFSLSGGGFWSGGGGSWSGGGKLTQIFGFGRLGFDYPFRIQGKEQRIVVLGGYSYRQIELDLEFKDRDDKDRADPKDRKSMDFTADFESDTFELREAYGEFELPFDIIIAVGRQRPTWGQFDIFSVVNGILPIEIQSSDFGVSNSNLRMPQDMVQITWFPLERLELSAYMFYQTTFDPLLRKAFVESRSFMRVGSGTIEGATCDDKNECKLNKNDLEGEEDITYAARALWRGDSFTVGLTFSQGRHDLFSFNRRPMVEASGSGYNVIPTLELPDVLSIGGELSIVLGAWTLKSELVYLDTQADIIYGSDENASSPAAQAFFKFIVDENDNKGYVDVGNIRGQVGFSADYGAWDFGLSLLFFQSILDDKAKEARDLYDAYHDGDSNPLDSDVIGIPVLPTAYLFYGFGEDEKHKIGLFGGFLGAVAGGALVYTGTDLFGEYINLTSSLEYTTSLASQLISDLEESERATSSRQSVSLASDLSFSFRIGASFEF